MKRLVIVTAVFISHSIIGFSQEASTEVSNREKFQIGLKGGINYSNVYDIRGEAFLADPKLGLVVGGFISIPIGKYLGVQPEVLLSQKGFHANGMMLGVPYTFTRTTTFIDVPVLFAFKPSEFLSLLGGLEYSYLTNQQDVFENSTTSIAQEKAFRNDNIRKNIFGFIGGLDLNFNHVVIGGRVGWDVQNNNGYGTVTSPRYKNIWYQLTIGFKFYK